MSATVIDGYILTNGDNTGHVAIGQFEDGSQPWQVQIYNANGALEAADYFPSEVEALRWATKQGLTPPTDEPQPTGTFAALSSMHSAYGRLHDLASAIAEEEVEWSDDIQKRLSNLLAGPCLAAMAAAGTALAGEFKADPGVPRSYREFLESVAGTTSLADEFEADTDEGADLRDRYDDVDDYQSDLDDDRLCSEFTTLQGFIDQARALKATADAAAKDHPAIKFSQVKDIIATGSKSGIDAGGGQQEATEIYRLFGIEVPNLADLEEGAVLGVCTSGMLVQWNADEQRCYVCETLDEFGIHNLREEERARVGLTQAAKTAASAT